MRRLRIPAVLNKGMETIIASNFLHFVYILIAYVQSDNLPPTLVHSLVDIDVDADM